MAADTGARPATAEETAPARGWSLRSVAEALALYAAVPALLMYPLGLAVLCLQIRLSYLDSLSATWYAANLVPRPVAMGVGIGALWNAAAQPNLARYAVVFAAAAGLMVLVAARKRRRPVREQEEAATETIAKARYHVRIPVVDLVLLVPNRPAAVVMVGLPLAWAALVTIGLAYSAIVGQWGYALSRAVLFFSFVLGVLLLTKDTLDFQYGYRSLVRAPLRGSAVLFSGLLLSALIGSAAREPSLPRVELTGGEVRAEGRLLAHEGGQWYIFEDGSRELHAVPDRRAGDATIGGGRN